MDFSFRLLYPYEDKTMKIECFSPLNPPKCYTLDLFKRRIPVFLKVGLIFTYFRNTRIAFYLWIQPYIKCKVGN